MVMSQLAVLQGLSSNDLLIRTITNKSPFAAYKFVITIDYYSFAVTSTEGTAAFGSNLINYNWRL